MLIALGEEMMEPTILNTNNILTAKELAHIKHYLLQKLPLELVTVVLDFLQRTQPFVRHTSVYRFRPKDVKISNRFKSNRWWRRGRRRLTACSELDMLWSECRIRPPAMHPSRVLPAIDAKQNVVLPTETSGKFHHVHDTAAMLSSVWRKGTSDAMNAHSVDVDTTSIAKIVLEVQASYAPLPPTHCYKRHLPMEVSRSFYSLSSGSYRNRSLIEASCDIHVGQHVQSSVWNKWLQRDFIKNVQRLFTTVVQPNTIRVEATVLWYADRHTYDRLDAIDREQAFRSHAIEESDGHLAAFWNIPKYQYSASTRTDRTSFGAVLTCLLDNEGASFINLMVRHPTLLSVDCVKVHYLTLAPGIQGNSQENDSKIFDHLSTYTRSILI